MSSPEFFLPLTFFTTIDKHLSIFTRKCKFFWLFYGYRLNPLRPSLYGVDTMRFQDMKEGWLIPWKNIWRPKPFLPYEQRNKLAIWRVHLNLFFNLSVWSCNTPHIWLRLSYANEVSQAVWLGLTNRWLVISVFSEFLMCGCGCDCVVLIETLKWV